MKFEILQQIVILLLDMDIFLLNGFQIFVRNEKLSALTSVLALLGL